MTSTSKNSISHLAHPHSLSIEDALDQLDSFSGGLPTEEASKRLLLYGQNRLPDPPKESLIRRFFKHFHDLLIYILIAAAGITALLGHFIDTGVIMGVVVINAIIGFIQEGKAEKALEGIRKMLSLHAYVRRDGRWLEIEAQDLVPGDIVRLRSGNRVPADIRLMESNNLRIEESALTGESVPSEKSTQPSEKNTGVGDQVGMAFSGTMVVTGSAIGVVTGTGKETQIGKINTMISEVETLDTPLTKQMAHFSKILSIVIVSMAIVMFFVGYLLHDFTMSDLFLASIGFAVAAIPEGLPAILTITLALGVQRMAGQNAITRKLNAVETLGSVTVICSDKTGTLTRNEMTARTVITREGSFEVTGTGYEPKGELLLAGSNVSIQSKKTLEALIETVAVANDTQLHEENGQWLITGEPTEGSLCTLAQKARFDSSRYKRLSVIPFESDHKYMATLHSTGEGERKVLLKGAPNVLLELCKTQMNKEGEAENIDVDFWESHIEKMSAQGLRVLAAAQKVVPQDCKKITHEDVTFDMVFVGLIGIIDPPRPEAIAAISQCHQAGIQVKMITGDHAGTAKAIGIEMGIGLPHSLIVVTGDQIEKSNDEELQKLVLTSNIFARTSPEHKLRLVKALQAQGQVVAMTGDGVNDAPALKRADVGVAMGIKGTEATKEAAEIVLADDNFSSIAHAVEEGRTTYDNLRKAILFILPTNGAEGFVMLAAIVFGMVLPLLPVQILWVNMVTAVTLALALAFEPSEKDVMMRPPRKPGASIIDKMALFRITYISLLIGCATIFVFKLEMYLGLPLELARTVTINTLVFAQAFYLLNSRFLQQSALSVQRLLSNRVAWISIFILIVLQLGFVYLPFMNTLFGTTPIEMRHWGIPIGIGFIIFLIIEAEKSFFRHTKKA